MKNNYFFTPCRLIIAVLIFSLSIILGYAIEESIKDTEWFNNLVGIMKIIFENILLFLSISGIIIVIFLSIYWKIRDYINLMEDNIVIIKKDIKILNLKSRFVGVIMESYKFNPYVNEIIEEFTGKELLILFTKEELLSFGIKKKKQNKSK